MYTKVKTPLNLLLAEDNPGDIRIIEEIIKDYELVSKMNVVYNGEEAIQSLTETLNVFPENLPDLLILDMNLPRLNGKEVLKFIRNHIELQHLPVVMMTSSENFHDISWCYQHFANCFIQKPMSFEDFHHTFRLMLDYWSLNARISK
jgi:CheY-like chemotaxis protein